MATLGRWRGTNVAALPNSTTFGAPSNLFSTQVRNDSSAYTFTASTSTLTLPSTGLADGYLLMARVETDDTSNGRFNPIGQIVPASGTGTFVNSPGAGYSRDTSEDRAYFNTWAFVHNPSASSTYQFQWKRDVDAATGTTIIATFDVIPFYYNDIGLYTSTSAALYGGTTPNQVTGWTGTNGTNITLASNAVTCAADNVKYLCIGSQYYEGRGGRTQRWMGWRVGGTKIDYGKSYAYYRTGSDDSNGGNFYHMFETATANVTVDQFCYRGDGVAAGQGGADIDGSTPTVGDHAMVIMELNSNAEGFHSIDNTGGVDLNVTILVNQALCRTAAISFNDTASFTRASDTAMNVVQTSDIFVAANITAAQELVATTSRWTAYIHPVVNGSIDTDIFHGNYGRNNQGSQDTFGWGCNAAGFIGATAGDDVGIGTTELLFAEDGGQFEVQPNWSGFLGLNLDTLEAAAVDTTPDQFTFTDQTGVEFSTQQTSNTITVAGMDAGQSVTVTVTGGTYSKNGGAYTSASGTAQNGDTFSVRHTSSAGELTAVNTTLTIETVSDTFTTTTRAFDTTPDAFTFTDLTNVAVSTQQTSNTITVAGMDTGQSATVTVTGGTYSKNSGAYVSTAGTAQNGDTFSVRHTSSASNSTAVDTTLTIGGVSDTFTSTTAAASSNEQYSVTSGEITLGGVQTFFSDTGSIALGDLYRGGGIVPDITENAAVPTTGEIANSDMYGVYRLASADTTPDQFTFTDVTNVAVSTTQTSNTITVAGMDVGASATVTVTGGTYSKNSGAYTSAAGTAQNGDTFSVQHTSSGSNSTATDTTLTIGGVSDTYTSTTTSGVSPPTVVWSLDLTTTATTNVYAAAGQTPQVGDVLVMFTAGGFGDPSSSVLNSGRGNAPFSVAYEDGNTSPSERIQYRIIGDADVAADVDVNTVNSTFIGNIVCVRGVDENSLSSTTGQSSSGSWFALFLDDTSLVTAGTSFTTTISDAVALAWNVITNSTTTYAGTVDAGSTFQDQVQGQSRSVGVGYISSPATGGTSNSTTFDLTGGGTDTADFYLVLPPPQGTADVTPSNTTWFNDIVTAASTGTSNTVTVTGINRRITLSLSCTEPDENYAVRVYINGQLATNQTNAPISAASPLEFTVSNGDDIYIWANGGDTRDATATIRNVSDGNVQLGNSFLITLND